MIGNPTWSFMWRKIVKQLAANGYRAIAIDMIGMGRSDKPTRMKDYPLRGMKNGSAKPCSISSICTTCIWCCMIGAALSACAWQPTIKIVWPASLFQTPDYQCAIAETMMRWPCLAPVFCASFSYLCALIRFGALVYVGQDLRQHIGQRGRCRCRTLPQFRYLTGNRQFTQMLPTRYAIRAVDNFRARKNWRPLTNHFSVFFDKDIVAPTGHQSVRPFIKSAAKRER